jgi:hypothetical protein
MAYQAVNRVVAANSEADNTWQTAVVRSITDEMLIPPPPPADMLADKDRVTSQNASEQPDAIAIIQRVGGLSIGELDKTIQRLQQVRAFLVNEEERMRREMAEYMKLTQSAINSTKAMTEVIANFGSAPNS